MAKKWMNPELLALKRSIDDRLNIADVAGNHIDASRAKAAQPRENSIKARRERRKNERKLRKTRRLAFARHTPVDSLVKKVEKDEKKKKQKEKKKAKKLKEAGAEKSPSAQDESASRQLIKFKKEAAKEARKQQRRLVREEDKEVRKYAKKLGFQKRKSKTLPKSFEADGLSYLLEVCDFKTNHFEEGAPDASTSRSGARKDSGDISDDSELEDGSWEESMELACQDGESGEEVEKETSSHSAGHSKSVSFADSLIADVPKEDIYGRTLNDEGNVVGGQRRKLTTLCDETSGAEQESVKLVQLRKNVNGIVNRLSEANIPSACSKISGLLTTYSRHDVKNVVKQIVFKACLQQQRLPFRLMLEHAMFIALLYSTVSSDFGAEMVEGLVKRLDELRTNEATGLEEEEDKTMENCIVLLCHLVDFKVVNSVVITEILKEFISDFGGRAVDLITVTLQVVGFTLRKEDPVGLRDVISLIQTKARDTSDTKVNDQTRLAFMLETLTAIKNNNDVSKVMQYDPSLLQHLRKVLQGLAKDKTESPLRVTLSDIRNASTSGRWWVVGSAWDPSAASLGTKTLMSGTGGDDGKSASDQKFSADLLELARKHRMNTDVRRTIFCVMLSAEDYLDAFEKLLKLSYKGSLEREIIHIAVNCCVREKQFNPYYAHLIHKFCSYHKRFQLTTQFALWDKIKQLDALKIGERKRLARLTAAIVALKALGLGVLKVADLSNSDDVTDKFVEDVLKKLCNSCELETLQEIVTQSALQPKLKDFCEGLRFFISRTFLSNTDDDDAGKPGRGAPESEKTERQRFVFIRNLLHISSSNF